MPLDVKEIKKLEKLGDKCLIITRQEIEKAGFVKRTPTTKQLQSLNAQIDKRIKNENCPD
jgi:Tfp pilus assembly protein PilN